MENNLYNDLPENSMTPFTGMPKDVERGISLVRELSPQEHLREIMSWLRGEMWNEDEKEYKPVRGAEPFMNSEGIDMFFHYATSIISPIVTMSNYTNDVKLIHRMVIMLVKKASIHFHLHYKVYGINKKTKISVLSDKLTILGLSAMYKAIGAGDRKAATSNITENINQMMRPNEPIEREGFSFNPFRRRRR